MARVARRAALNTGPTEVRVFELELEARRLLQKIRDMLVIGETPSGAVDGANTTFTLLHIPTLNSQTVFLNGLRQQPTIDYTISGAVITYGVAPVVGDQLRVNYMRIL